ncbi:asparagine synthase C-terminal domain-containing protein [Thalassotalea castellviae]|uniref:asparagine synthase (glutamine-hydrolyzing) n=1 Tax=Thalassotalea castellviae TaxID=3075612 RepID=A0ABU3A1G8_9GAMM|nr:asparagine synthase C-terminal domain-containing protein [Thalassotalea sp. W431]MDT0603809.1 asparagine synthase C-terminal domain-containing protein [Thalassotalea sp. W431]
MPGFCIKRHPKVIDSKDYHLSVGQFTYEINAKDCINIPLPQGGLILLDGYFWPQDTNKFKEIILTKQFDQLSQFEGHYSGICITEEECLIFNDRFGGKTIFYQQNENLVTIASRICLLPVENKALALDAVHECFIFRWTSADKTLLSDTCKLRARSYGTVSHKGTVKQQCYWQLPPANYTNAPFKDKQTSVKHALQTHLRQASQRYKKVAIFLSGGVDSSLLAGLSKDIFDQCYLVTPVFKGQKNPELATAKAFAKQLDMPHHLVEVNPETLEQDLQYLIQLKREPLRHYSSLAMLAMMKAIPDEYDAVIYGEAADTLFGSNGINRINTQYNWKQSTKHIPLWLLELIKKIVPGRGKVLVDLKSISLTELIYSLTAIQYSEKSNKVIKQIDLGRDSKLETKPWQQDISAIMRENVRHVAQRYIISSDVEKHFEEAELIAEQFNKHIISPFFAPDVIDLANTLNDSDYYGTEFVKPILREIACEYFDRELIYQRKYGFPVPLVDWLNGSLSSLVEEVRNEKRLFNGKLLDGLSVDADYEIFWLLINWKILHQQLEAQ